MPFAANCVLRVISWVAAPCCCTAAAIAVATSLTSPMMPPMFLMASMASPATFWMSAICSEISSVALAVWLGQRLDLGGHDRKAAAGLAGARGLDGGVQRQQVGLRGDGR